MDLFKKLNLKSQTSILCLYPPESFEDELDKLPSEIRIIRQISRVKQIEFAMVFVTSQTTIDTVVPKLARKFADDVVLWMCYPKKSSKRYTCDFNRDSGWDVLGQHDMEGVRIVAIDEDWSALRFRQVDHIKTMKRTKLRTLSKKGAAKTQATRKKNAVKKNRR